MNEIKLAGRIDSAITFLKETQRGNIVEFYLTSRRTSGAEDTLRIVAKEELLANYNYGDDVSIIGSVKTRNEDGHLRIYVSAEKVSEYDEKDIDIVEIDGFVCSKKDLRKTPLTEQAILEIVVAVNNKIGSSYIPCIFWNGLAYKFEDLLVGTELKIKGRLQSRKYLKVLSENETEVRTAYELSVFDVEKVEDK